ncbi:hypothetical protein Hanom_Chr16g01523151 [Helianthus anomalus]
MGQAHSFETIKKQKYYTFVIINKLVRTADPFIITTTIVTHFASTCTSARYVSLTRSFYRFRQSNRNLVIITCRPGKWVGLGRVGSWVKTGSGQNGFGSERVRVGMGFGSERVSGRVGLVKKCFF